MKTNSFDYLLFKIKCLSNSIFNVQQSIALMTINNVVTTDSEYQINPGENYITFIGTDDAYLPSVINNTGLKYNLMNQGAEIVMVHSNSGENDIYYSGSMVNFVSIDPGTKLEIYNNSLKYFTT